jgi:exopolysaccharide biosynthesis protein
MNLSMKQKIKLSVKQLDIVLVFLLFISLSCTAISGMEKKRPVNTPQTDSVKVVQAVWEVQKVAGSTFFKQCRFTDSSLFKSNQIISIIVLDGGGLVGEKKESSPKIARRVVEIVSAEERATTSFLAKSNEGIAAVNGSFFDMDTTRNASVTYLRIDGKVLSQNKYDKNGVEQFIAKGDDSTLFKRKFFHEAAIATKNGKLFILKAGGKLNWESSVKADDMLCTGPLLMIDGKEVQLEQTPFNNNRHNRTGVAVTKNGTLLLITVDGRTKEANGMSLKEFASIGRWLGAYDMVNLDGGGSTSMFIVNRGVVNYPSDNLIFDHAGERSVANAVIIRFSK